jgi:glycerophosphoryl diester phosphodiesterase
MAQTSILGGVLIALTTMIGTPVLAATAAEAGDKIAATRQAFADASSSHIITVAHRACWETAPENSLAAIDACVALGVDAVELDVRHTRDGVAVIIHDETVDRTTNGHGRVSDLSWKQLSRLRLRTGGGGAGAALTTARVPTLDQYIASAKGRVMIVYDVKDGSQRETFKHIEKASAANEAIFFYECVDPKLANAIAPFRDRVVAIPIMFGKDGPLAPAAARCRSNPPGWAHVKWSDGAWLGQVQADQNHAPIRLWTATMFPEDNAGRDDALALVDPEAVWGQQIKAGARMIMTNKPSVLMTYLRKR